MDAVNKRMRATGKNYPADKKEKRPAFPRRLTRTAKSIPHEGILEAQRSMQVQPILCKGGQFGSHVIFKEKKYIFHWLATNMLSSGKFTVAIEWLLSGY